MSFTKTQNKFSRGIDDKADGTAVTIDETGKVGVGTSDPSQKLTISDVSAPVYISQNRGNVSSLVGPDGADGGLYIGTTSDHEVRMHTSGERRLTIDTAGNSNFSGTVTAGSVETPEVSGNHFSLSSATFVEADTGEDIAYYGLTLDTSTNYWTRFSGFTGCAFYTNGQKRLAIDADGDAQFSGSVTADDGTFSNTFVAGKNAGTTTIDNRSIYSPYVGIRLGGGQFPDNILPCDDGGSSTGGKVNLGHLNYKFKDGHFSGTVYANGSPLTRTRDLVTTLSTLHRATMDETKDIRESLRSAIEELIEGFEQQIAAMPTSEAGE